MSLENDFVTKTSLRTILYIRASLVRKNSTGIGYNSFVCICIFYSSPGSVELIFDEQWFSKIVIFSKLKLLLRCFVYVLEEEAPWTIRCQLSFLIHGCPFSATQCNGPSPVWGDYPHASKGF